MSIAMTEAITTLSEAERQLNLTRTEDESFFSEWHLNLPALTELQKANLTEMRRRYLYQRSEGHLLEGTITLLFASPILTIAGFYDPPFKVRAEESVKLTIEDSEETLQGRIDVLVLKEQLWVIVLESKKTALSVWSALPQALVYMAGNPTSKLPSFRLMTNGDDSVFVKLTKSTQTKGGQYDFSRVFASLTSNQELYHILRVLEGLGQIVRQA